MPRLTDMAKMTDLEEGIEHRFTRKVSEAMTVPELFPVAEELDEMPAVLASGYLVGLIEWACIDLLMPFLDWPEEQTVGTGMEFSHEAPTPPGFEVAIDARLTDVDDRLLTFDVECADGVESIGSATHTRYIIDRDQFNAGVEKKKNSVSG